MAKFSIITITYNAGKTLGRTLESVLEQTYDDLEHIVVDGGSTDNTVEKVQDYRRRSEEVANGHYVHITSEADDGIYDAMNKGIRLASGDYIVFLNAGDWLPESDIIERIAERAQLKEKLKEEWPAVIYGDTDIVDGEGRFIRHRRLSPPLELTWKSFRHGMTVCHQAFYVRMDMAKYIYFDLKYKYSADVDWCIRVLKEAERERLPIVNTEMVVANYLSEGQTTLHHNESLRERFAVMSNHYGLATTVVMHMWFVLRAIIRK